MKTRNELIILLETKQNKKTRQNKSFQDAGHQTLIPTQETNEVSPRQSLVYELESQ